MSTFRLERVDVFFRREPFRRPLALSGGTIDALTLALARAVLSDGRREQTGYGAVYLSHAWAWPGPQPSPGEKDALMREFTLECARRLPEELPPFRHPFHPCLELEDISRTWGGPSLPQLARTVCLSAVDAALFDAHGRLAGTSAYDLLDKDSVGEDMSRPLGAEGAGLYPAQALAAALDSTPAWAATSPGDVLTEGDVDEPLSDGLPETLCRWIEACRISHLKVKIKGEAGSDVEWIERLFDCTAPVISSLPGAPRPVMELDANGGFEDASCAETFLRKLRERRPEIFGCISYLEQPLAEDTVQQPVDVSSLASLMPVVLDDGAHSIDHLKAAKDLGYSGIGLKTCKGQSRCLLYAAWAQRNQMLLSLQDLTNPSISAVQSAGLARRLRTLNGVELNSYQFTPSANRDIGERHPGLLPPKNGLHRLDTIHGPGLGYSYYEAGESDWEEQGCSG